MQKAPNSKVKAWKVFLDQQHKLKTWSVFVAWPKVQNYAFVKHKVSLR